MDLNKVHLTDIATFQLGFDLVRVIPNMAPFCIFSVMLYSFRYISRSCNYPTKVITYKPFFDLRENLHVDQTDSIVVESVTGHVIEEI